MGTWMKKEDGRLNRRRSHRKDFHQMRLKKRHHRTLILLAFFLCCGVAIVWFGVHCAE